jgi:hypothetical protein
MGVGYSPAMHKRLVLRVGIIMLLMFGVRVANSTDYWVPNAGEIVAGRSVGDLKLGDSQSRVSEIFRLKPNIDQETFLISGPTSCHRKEIHWLDMEKKSGKFVVHNGVWIYLKEDRVVQVESMTPRFRTPEGITEHSGAEQIRHSYRDLQTFTLTNSGSKINGYRDLVYWVDKRKGIAFEFQGRFVSKIAIFAADTQFQPEGCVDEPQTWKELVPYSLEP